MSRQKLTIEISTQDQSLLLAQDIAMAMRMGDVITFIGDLGAGKSYLCRAILRALAGDETLEVPSPTYNLVHEYPELPIRIAHCDFYRMGDEDEVFELGLASFVETGAAIIEWPQIGQSVLPEPSLAIEIEILTDEARKIHFDMDNDFASRFQRSTLIRQFIGAQNRSYFLADASARSYELLGNGADTSILMNAPKAPDGPPIKDGLPYSQLVHLAEDVGPFVAIANALRQKGYAAPQIIKQNVAQGILQIEDLGRGKIVDDDGKPIASRYIAAAELLAQLHAENWEEKCLIEADRHHVIPQYDVTAMQMGLSLLPDWWGKHNALSEDAAAELYDLWEPHFERFQTGYKDLILRDYHSPNIVWIDGPEQSTLPKKQIGLIDFQDALIGPGVYDLASLMRDARVTINVSLQEEICDAYCEKASALMPSFDTKQCALDVATLAAFRSSRLLGLWIRLDLRDGKPRFRQNEPRTIQYLQQSLAHNGLSDLRSWYEKHQVIS